MFPGAVLRVALQAVLLLRAPVLVFAVIPSLTVLAIGLGAAAAPAGSRRVRHRDRSPVSGRRRGRPVECAARGEWAGGLLWAALIGPEVTTWAQNTQKKRQNYMPST